MVFGLSALQLAVGLAAATLYGLAKTGVPSMGALGAGLLATVIPALPSTGVALPILLVGDLIAISIYRRHARLDVLLALLPSVVIGLILGFLVLRDLNQHTGSIILGVVLLLSVIGELVRRRSKKMFMADEIRRSKLSQLLGVGAGLSTMVANAGGPFMTLYLLRLRVTSRELMGTVTWFFFVLNIMKVPLSVHLGLIDLHSLRQSAALIPGIAVGTFIGYRLIKRISNQTFETLALLGTAVTAIWLLR